MIFIWWNDEMWEEAETGGNHAGESGTKGGYFRGIDDGVEEAG